MRNYYMIRFQHLGSFYKHPRFVSYKKIIMIFIIIIIIITTIIIIIIISIAIVIGRAVRFWRRRIVMLSARKAGWKKGARELTHHFLTTYSIWFKMVFRTDSRRSYLRFHILSSIQIVCLFFICELEGFRKVPKL